MYSFYKIFQKSKDDEVTVKLFEYDKKGINNYLNLIKEKNQEDYRQVILNSFLMINIIKYLVEEKGLTVEKITFIDDDDDEYYEEIETILKTQKEYYLERVIQELNILKSKDSIEINEVCFGKYNSDMEIRIKVNGIVLVNNEDSETVRALFEKFLTGQFK